MKYSLLKTAITVAISALSYTATAADIKVVIQQL